jgi:hypothetical protein
MSSDPKFLKTSCGDSCFKHRCTKWHTNGASLRSAFSGRIQIVKKALVSLIALAFIFYIAPAAHAADWVYLGKAHVDGQHDHDNIEVGQAAGRYRKLEIRVVNAPIEFDRVVVHYGNGQAETLQVRQFIRAGGHTRGIDLQGDRIVQSLELWYGKAHPFSARPEVTLFGRP